MDIKEHFACPIEQLHVLPPVTTTPSVKVLSWIADTGAIFYKLIFSCYFNMTTETPSAKYTSHKFNLSKAQIKSIVDSIKSKEPIVLKLTKNNYLDGTIELPLNKADALNVSKNKGFYYSLNKSKIKLMGLEEHSGGFLPILLGILGGLAGLATAGATVANSVINSKSKQAELQEAERHNREMESVAKGDGIYLNPPKYDGNSIKAAINKSKLDNAGKKTFRSFLKNLSDNYTIEVRDGSGLYLSPIA